MNRGGRICAACTHPERDQIDIDLAAGGESGRSLARRYGMSEAALRRHRLRHRNPELAALTAQRTSTVAQSSDGMGEGLWALRDRCEAFLIDAEKSGNATQAMAAIREMRNLWELWGRATGALKERPAVVMNLLVTDQWLEYKEVFFEILQRHPEALAEVRAALKKRAA